MLFRVLRVVEYAKAHAAELGRPGNVAIGGQSVRHLSAGVCPLDAERRVGLSPWF